jgi:hypothetical protein
MNGTKDIKTEKETYTVQVDISALQKHVLQNTSQNTTQQIQQTHLNVIGKNRNGNATERQIYSESQIKKQSKEEQNNAISVWNKTIEMFKKPKDIREVTVCIPSDDTKTINSTNVTLSKGDVLLCAVRNKLQKLLSEHQNMNLNLDKIANAVSKILKVTADGTTTSIVLHKHPYNTSTTDLVYGAVDIITNSTNGSQTACDLAEFDCSEKTGGKKHKKKPMISYTKTSRKHTDKHNVTRVIYTKQNSRTKRIEDFIKKRTPDGSYKYVKV